MFRNIYSGKKVLITGNTGFKGSWLSSWLLRLGAKVYGISKDIPTSPSIFETIGLEDHIDHVFMDIRDLSSVTGLVRKVKPDFVFHLAAQPLVGRSYLDPVETLTTNVIGTTNILEALRVVNNHCIAVVITSDKCYDNVEWEYGYKETDVLGGKDIYSGSKGCAELVIKSYFHSFFNDRSKSNIKLVSARAGNVIGGGDWAENRIVPDCIRSWNNGESVEIRSPFSTRPWQHVLEPLSGYLNLGMVLSENDQLNGSSFNFGPPAEYSKTVKELLDDLSIHWNLEVEPSIFPGNNTDFHEYGLLKLNCDKALFYLKWLPTLDYNMLIKFTSAWYYSYYKKNIDMSEFTFNQISEYEKLAIEKGISWAK